MKGFVYKIESDCKQILYIGSTTRKLNKRFNDHKKTNGHCVISKYLKDSNYMFSKGCELIKEYEIADRKHLLAYEQLWINKLKKNINKQKTYKLLEKEHKKQYNKKYDRQYREQKKQYNKQYYEDNKEYYKKYDRQYRELNKEKISEQKKQKVTCECKAIVSNRNLSTHQKTKKHQDYLSTKDSACSR